jgi:molybdopterin/thiamine biosynthesis adenylyltransferase
MFTTLKYQKQIVTKALKSNEGCSVFDRQERIAGFNQNSLAQAHAVIIGNGGIGGETGEGLARKGMGAMTCVDHDIVEFTNLNRQLFFKRDVGKPKAWRIIENLKAHCTGRTILTGLNLRFQDALALGIDFQDASLFICGVDNGEARVAVSKHFQKLGIPGIFIAISLDAASGYVFLQESKPDKPCFGCLFHKNPYGHPAPCRTPACKDILKVVAGLALYAIDSLLMERKRNWNFRMINLAGFMPDDLQTIERYPECPLCSHE